MRPFPMLRQHNVLYPNPQYQTNHPAMGDYSYPLNGQYNFPHAQTMYNENFPVNLSLYDSYSQHEGFPSNSGYSPMPGHNGYTHVNNSNDITNGYMPMHPQAQYGGQSLVPHLHPLYQGGQKSLSQGGYSPFANPLQAKKEQSMTAQYPNPYPKQAFMQKSQPSGFQSIMNQFKTQDGSIDVTKMMNTAGQMMGTVNQVQSMVKGLGGIFKTT